MQKFQEISLGDHGNLGKLDRIQSDDLLDLLVRLPLFALKGAPVRQDQLNLGRFLHISGRAVSIAPFSQPDIFRIPADRIFFSLIRECVFYISIHIFRGILAAHHIPVPRFAAGLVIQRIGNGIKYGRLPRSGIPGYQKQPLLHSLKIYRRHFCIRAEG